MYQRLHHQAIAQVLHALDGELLRLHECLFGGGTVIAMRYGEYRESLDIGFMVSSTAGFRELRQLVGSGLLANADRWYDNGAFNRDLIDLAKAIDRVENRNGWLERCMEVMAMDIPKAVLWKYIRRLKKIL